MYIVPFLIFLWLLSFHQGKESDRKLNDNCAEGNWILMPQTGLEMIMHEIQMLKPQ